VTARNITKSYGPKLVIDKQNLQIDRGEKVAFVGKNGMGKTTYSRILVGDLEYQGELELGHNVTIGYYAQHAADSMDVNDTVLDVVDRVATGDIRTKLRDLLGCFLFKGEDVYKKVKVLSGGEKGRLALCKMILEPRNFLVLDEPTNHLDILSKEILKKAINAFEGTVLIISHDRDFLSGLTTRTVEFTKQGIKEHIGSIEDFLAKKQMEDMRMLAKKEDDVPVTGKRPVVNNSAVSKDDTDKKKEQEKQLRKLKNDLEKSEGIIATLEADIQNLDNKLQDPALFQQLTQDPAFYANYDKLKKQLDEEMVKWEMISQQITELG
jgi:ATP-binding cassette subfamily F protein 3